MDLDTSCSTKRKNDTCGSSSSSRLVYWKVMHHECIDIAIRLFRTRYSWSIFYWRSYGGSIWLESPGHVHEL